jgi:mannose-6-phosphate isomerase-like protein (cupin superfamily)
MAAYEVVRLDEVEPIAVAGVTWLPLRRLLGVLAFGVNAYRANAGEHVVEEHDELGAAAGHHEELYVVLSGRATFTLGGEPHDAPAGTVVFLPEPEVRRGAVAHEDGTTVLAVGGRRGEAYEVSPWEFAFAAEAHRPRAEWDEAVAVVAEGLRQHPDNARLLYWTACWEALAGRREDALGHLARALELDPALARWAADDDDLDSIRDDPRYAQAAAGAALEDGARS